MGGGGSKKSKINEHDRAVLELKTTRDKLKQYQKQVRLFHCSFFYLSVVICYCHAFHFVRSQN
jgi:hypothetical protein